MKYRSFLKLGIVMFVLIFVSVLIFGYFSNKNVRVVSPFKPTTQFLSSVINSFVSDFSVIEESSSMSTSTNSKFWLNSGGRMTVSGDIAQTIQGDLGANDKWYVEYKRTNPGDTDSGIHPQNIFRLVTKTTWFDSTQEAYFRIDKLNNSSSPNRNASNGLLFFNRYKDGNNLYYAGIRVDGNLIVKKKINGNYYTVASKKVIPGVYNINTNPNLLPVNTWIGLKSEIFNSQDGKVTINVYTNFSGNTWVKELSAIDDGINFGGQAFTTNGYSGVRTDFMDVSFKDYKISDIAPKEVISLDSVSPVIQIVGASEDVVLQNSFYRDLGAIVQDNLDPSPRLVTIGVPVLTDTSGDKIITYTAYDKSGNKSSVSRTIHVIARSSIISTPNTSTSCDNLLAKSTFYRDKDLQALREYQKNPSLNKDIATLACTPQSIWISNRTSKDIQSYVDTKVSLAEKSNKIPVLTIYNSPDTKLYKWGSGLQNGEAYISWVTKVAKGIGTKKAWVILEPDLLGLSFNYLKKDSIDARNDLRNALLTIKNNAPNTKVYIDAGHSNWRKVTDVVGALKETDIFIADGFVTNVSNFRSTNNEIDYGYMLSSLLNNKHFIIDTSRNGQGPSASNEWCNPPGRSIGHSPTISTGYNLIDAFLWVKNPGESDGTCNGGPSAGKFWYEYGVSLVKPVDNLTENLSNQGIIIVK